MLASVWHIHDNGSETNLGEIELDCLPQKGSIIYLYVYNKKPYERGLPYERTKFKVIQVDWKIAVGDFKNTAVCDNKVEIRIKPAKLPKGK